MYRLRKGRPTCVPPLSDGINGSMAMRLSSTIGSHRFATLRCAHAGNVKMDRRKVGHGPPCRTGSMGRSFILP